MNTSTDVRCAGFGGPFWDVSPYLNPWGGWYPPEGYRCEPLWTSPARVAQKCPVCVGSGKVTDPDTANTTNPWPKTCHGCAGKGWVVA